MSSCRLSSMEGKGSRRGHLPGIVKSTSRSGATSLRRIWSSGSGRTLPMGPSSRALAPARRHLLWTQSSAATALCAASSRPQRPRELKPTTASGRHLQGPLSASSGPPAWLCVCRGSAGTTLAEAWRRTSWPRAPHWHTSSSQEGGGLERFCATSAEGNSTLGQS